MGGGRLIDEMLGWWIGDGGCGCKTYVIPSRRGPHTTLLSENGRSRDLARGHEVSVDVRCIRASRHPKDAEI